MHTIPVEFYDHVKKEDLLGVFFAYRTLLHPIQINEDNYQAFREDVDYLIKFNEALGKQIITLSAGISSIYNIETDMKNETLSYEQCEMIKQIHASCGIMSFSLYELHLINERFLDTNEFIIEGEEYLFLSYMLLRIYKMYTSLIAYINYLHVFDEEFMESIEIYNQTILSPKFQQMRTLFRVTEWQRNIIETAKKESITVH